MGGANDLMGILGAGAPTGGAPDLMGFGGNPTPQVAPISSGGGMEDLFGNSTSQ